MFIKYMQQFSAFWLWLLITPVNKIINKRFVPDDNYHIK